MAAQPTAPASSEYIESQLRASLLNPAFAKVHAWRAPNTAPPFDDSAFIARLNESREVYHAVIKAAVDSIGSETESGE